MVSRSCEEQKSAETHLSHRCSRSRRIFAFTTPPGRESIVFTASHDPTDENSPQALKLSLQVLAQHGTLVLKIFLSPLDPQAEMLVSQFSCFFPRHSGAASDSDIPQSGVFVRKPRSSRAGSGEAFLVCRNFAGDWSEGTAGWEQVKGYVETGDLESVRALDLHYQWLMQLLLQLARMSPDYST